MRAILCRVTLDKRGRRNVGESKEDALARAVRTGNATTEKKTTGGTNASAHAGAAAASHLRKLEEDSETFAHATVDRSVSQAIQQARLAKKMTQKDLAQLIMEKPTVINELESGRAMPNGAIIGKLERALGVRLPRPPKK